MSIFTAGVLWQRHEHNFGDNRYSRRHVWRFDGGAEVLASASPSSVPVPQSDPAAVDPEEAFVASLASCHMLWFLAIAANRGFVVDQYEDAASGVLERNAVRRLAMTRVTLRPRVLFDGAGPTRAELVAMHHQAHEECYIANSVTTEIVVEPVTLP